MNRKKLSEIGTKVKNLLLYAGLDKEKNEEYKDFVLKQDVKKLSYYLVIAGGVFFLLSIASIVTSSFAHENVIIYLSTAVSLGIILLLQKLTIIFRGKTSRLHRIYIFLFMVTIYSESIAITIMHKNLPAVTYIGVLLMLPLLFAQYPLPMFLFQGAFVALFCIFTACFKNPDIVAIDVWNGITFLFVSLIEIGIVVPMRFNQIIQPEIIRKLSEKDMLTSVKNRNAFEKYCDHIRRMKENVLCVYADVNGLHEMNNKYGHTAGDNMLIEVAKVMISYFGEENVYRIGGDEFVAFSLETDWKLVEQKMIEAKRRLEDSGYYLSVGYSGPESSEDEIDSIIKRAEANMYKDKSIYYSKSGKDRRSR